MSILETHHYSADVDEFRKELVGKKILGVGHSTLLLEDGTELVIEAGGDCCAYFEGWFETVGDPEQAVVTRVDRVDLEETSQYGGDVNFSINIYAAHRQIAKAEVRGDEGTGYYGSSITLVVRKAV